MRRFPVARRAWARACCPWTARRAARTARACVFVLSRTSMRVASRSLLERLRGAAGGPGGPGRSRINAPREGWAPTPIPLHRKIGRAGGMGEKRQGVRVAPGEFRSLAETGADGAEKPVQRKAEEDGRHPGRAMVL